MAEQMVIDASVAAKWFLKDSSEADVDLADQLLVALLADDIEMHAPRVFTYEVCSLLTKACLTRDRQTKEPRLTKRDAAECVRRLFRLPIQHSQASSMEGVEALELAVDSSKTHYDMTYLRLAQELACHWCTADDNAVKAVPANFPVDHILLLSTLRD
ncbi:MAG: type II toxin-antitoxin system VapC family toxin [Phycisphaerae bacterium]|nr:type II toxin-antitoxin system VapC family toxin [Phycisphaerae bacterium]